MNEMIKFNERVKLKGLNFNGNKLVKIQKYNESQNQNLEFFNEPSLNYKYCQFSIILNCFTERTILNKIEGKSQAKKSS